MVDPYCLSLGIPERLHHAGQPELAVENPEDRLFRRYLLLTEATVTACIKFGDMSVNKEKVSTAVSTLAEDVLINHKTGQIYGDCGVVMFEAGSLCAPNEDGRWRLKDVPGTFDLRLKHKPLPCNYAHFDVEVFKDGEKVSKIKPTKIKLAIRHHLQSKLIVLLPSSQAGKSLPLG